MALFVLKKGAGYSYAKEHVCSTYWLQLTFMGEGNMWSKPFRSIYPTITDMKSAVDATRAAQILAYYIIFGYVMQIVSVITSGRSLYGTDTNDIIETYAFIGTYGVIVLVCWWMALRIRQNKFGSVPVLVAWTLFEIGMKTIEQPGEGLVISLLVGILAASSIRSWVKLRGIMKQEK